MSSTILRWAAGASTMMVLITGCDARGSASASASARQSGAPAAGATAALVGAGSTFAFPLYSKWAADYAAKTGVEVKYQPVGSSLGVSQLSDQAVDFGATDGPMSDDELARAKGGSVLHIPTALGAVVLTCNLPALGPALKLTGDAIAAIYLGTITKWNDARLVALNPGVKLPAWDVHVVHRSDGSGTTYVFTDYLTAVSPEWAKQIGKAKDVAWPIGTGGKGNEGVSAEVIKTPEAIGYVELTYATNNGFPIAAVKNAAGDFVSPTVASVTAAAQGVVETLTPTSDYRVSIVNAPGAKAYPISSFTWILAYANQTNATKAKQLKDFVRWGLTEGQQREAALFYAPLPAPMIPQLLQRLDSIRTPVTP